MQLKDYRSDKGLTLDDVAEMMGFKSASTVHRHETGVRIPRLDQVERYRKATGGAVTADDWVSLSAKTRKKMAALA